MGASFSLPRLVGMTDHAAIANLDAFEGELLLGIVRILIRDSPTSVGRLLCCCKSLVQLAIAKTTNVCIPSSKFFTSNPENGIISPPG